MMKETKDNSHDEKLANEKTNKQEDEMTETSVAKLVEKEGLSEPIESKEIQNAKSTSEMIEKTPTNKPAQVDGNDANIETTSDTNTETDTDINPDTDANTNTTQD